MPSFIVTVFIIWSHCMLAASNPFVKISLDIPYIRVRIPQLAFYYSKKPQITPRPYQRRCKDSA